MIMPSDLRCFRESHETLSVHSSVLLVSACPLTAAELGLLVKYDDSGFHLTLAVPECLPLSTFMHVERLYLPPNNCLVRGGLRDDLRWAYEHKDERYVDPDETPELNMGSRLYDYIKSLTK